MDIKKILKKIPISPGVYLFYDNSKKIIYIGKAANLSKRVSSYFQKRHGDQRIESMISNIRDIDYIPTASPAEALMCEASLIKEKKPKYNIALRDDKTYPYLKLTVKEKYPGIFITRKVEKDGALYFGPYTDVKLLRQALGMMKRVFHLRTCKNMPKKACLSYHLGHCMGVCVKKGVGSLYKEAVDDIKLFLKGRRKLLLKRLSQRMKNFSGNFQFEEALKIRDQIEALSAVIKGRKVLSPLKPDLKELKDALDLKRIPARIEAFDISNIHGAGSVGSMVTFFNAAPLKSHYRRYRIKEVKGIDDYAMIREVLRRRYMRLLKEKKNMPDLILIDGGKGHLNAASEEFKKSGLKIPVISIAKKPDRIFVKDSDKPLDISKNSKAFNLIQRIRDEAHRFAISYHKILRKKAMFK